MKPASFSRVVRPLMALAVLFVAALTPAALPAATPAAPAMIAFMTDFDVKDDAVAICKAVMDPVAPGVRVLDITHAIEPYNVAQAARYLAGTAPASGGQVTKRQAGFGGDRAQARWIGSRG